MPAIHYSAQICASLLNETEPVPISACVTIPGSGAFQADSFFAGVATVIGITCIAGALLSCIYPGHPEFGFIIDMNRLEKVSIHECLEAEKLIQRPMRFLGLKRDDHVVTYRNGPIIPRMRPEPESEPILSPQQIESTGPQICFAKVQWTSPRTNEEITDNVSVAPDVRPANSNINHDTNNPSLQPKTPRPFDGEIISRRATSPGPQSHSKWMELVAATRENDVRRQARRTSSELDVEMVRAFGQGKIRIR